MTWNASCLNNVAVLRLSGEIDQWEVPAIRTRLEESLRAAGWRALVDMSAVPWLSSMMIGLLIATHRLAAAAGGAVVFAGLAPTVRRRAPARSPRQVERPPAGSARGHGVHHPVDDWPDGVRPPPDRALGARD